MKKKYVVTFDVHSEHERIIQDLIQYDWHSVIQGYADNGSPVICYFPETTWWKEFNNVKEAFAEFDAIAGQSNIIRQTVSLLDEWRSTTRNPMKHQVEEARALRLVSSN